MHTKLYAYAFMACYNIVPVSEYTDYLNECFLNEPHDALLLELQWTKDIYAGIAILERQGIDSDEFGCMLIKQLRKKYHSAINERRGGWFRRRKTETTLRDFCELLYAIWCKLPSDLLFKNPYAKMVWISDCFEYSIPASVRDVCNEILDYFE
ncbi:MAG: hypothetical protein FWB93_04965 [Oscillospiraceae bacterium]|nr:hypothetical protein [Oscillospiraceae bacterium]